MLFCTKEYLYFFAVVLALYWALPWPRVRVWLLLAASFAFYAAWSRELACVVVGSATVDFFLARGIEASRTTRRKKWLLAGNLTMNLGLLCYFKYANFFLDSLRDTLHALGASASIPVLSIVLPIGISFYTFEAINYAVDVYRGKGRAERDLGNFLLFILFFPHLIAGPIVRARDFLPQIQRPKRWSWPRVHLGVWLLILGLFKKLAVADRMALFADPVFAHPDQYSSGAIWMAMVAFALQVYCDFSGYSDKALGSAHLLGYKLVVNFNLPFLAVNIADFWKRWHISLSTWLRDYLFIPLGGSRGGEWKTRRNLLITMSLGGIWHGAGWNFVLWGVTQGVLLIAQRAFAAWCRTRPRLDSLLQAPAGTIFRIAFTFLVFCLSLVVFRPASLHDSGVMFTRLFCATDGLPAPLYAQAFWLTVAIVALAHLAGASRGWRRWSLRRPEPLKGFAYAAILTTALILAPGATKAFIYFQF